MKFRRVNHDDCLKLTDVAGIAQNFLSQNLPLTIRVILQAMGSGASVDTYSDGELLAVATEFAKEQPERFEAITAAARSAAKAQQENGSAPSTSKS